jgi:hypothetical protein
VAAAAIPWQHVTQALGLEERLIDASGGLQRNYETRWDKEKLRNRSSLFMGDASGLRPV